MITIIVKPNDETIEWLKDNVGDFNKYSYDKEHKTRAIYGDGWVMHRISYIDFNGPVILSKERWELTLLDDKFASLYILSFK